MRLLFLLLLLYHNNKNSNPTRNAHPFSLFVLTPRQSCLVAYLLACSLLLARQDHESRGYCSSLASPCSFQGDGYIPEFLSWSCWLFLWGLVSSFTRGPAVCVCTPPHSHGRYFVGSWLMYRPFPMFMWRSPSPCLWTFCQPVCNIETYTHTQRERETEWQAGYNHFIQRASPRVPAPTLQWILPPPKYLFRFHLHVYIGRRTTTRHWVVVTFDAVLSLL